VCLVNTYMLDPKDLLIDVYTGGSVDVRIVHVPTGLEARGSHPHSRYQARKAAMDLLSVRVAERLKPVTAT
jgi:protein subunit release factor A